MKRGKYWIGLVCAAVVAGLGVLIVRGMRAVDAPTHAPEVASPTPDPFYDAWRCQLEAFQALGDANREAIESVFSRWSDGPLNPAGIAALGYTLRDKQSALEAAHGCFAPSATHLASIFQQIDGPAELPHVRPMIALSRGCLASAFFAAGSGDPKEGEKWAIASLHMLSQLGQGPTMLERWTAFMELARHSEVLMRLDSPEVRAAYRAELQNLGVDTADLFRVRLAVRMMGAKDARDLKRNRSALKDKYRLDIRDGDDFDVIAAVVERTMNQMSEAWSQPDAEAQIHRIEAAFPFERYRVMVSGVWTMARDHTFAAEAVRALLDQED